MKPDIEYPKTEPLIPASEMKEGDIGVIIESSLRSNYIGLVVRVIDINILVSISTGEYWLDRGELYNFKVKLLPKGTRVSFIIE